MKLRFLSLFLAWATIAAAHLFGIMADLNSLVVSTKILLMPALAIWFWLETRQFSPISSRNWVVSGLLLSWLGDCLLIFQAENSGIPYFLLGLGAFLGAHIFYLAAFLKFPSGSQSFLKKNKWRLLPFAAFLLAMRPSRASGH